MAITTKTVTGKIVVPGTTTGIRAEVTATPMTTASALTFPADDTISWGPVVEQTNGSGVLPSTFKIPTNPDQTEVMWKFVAKPLVKRTGLPAAWTLGYYEITGTGTVDLADLVEIDVTVIDPATVTSVQAMVTAAQLAETNAETAATNAAGFRDAALDAAADAATDADLAEAARLEAEQNALGFTGGTATALAPGAAPTMSVTGPAGARVLDLGIPAGLVDDASLTALDADENSAFRQQSDARQLATFARLGTDATQRLMALLDNETRDAAILVVGDSTGNETTEWVHRFAQSLAADWPTWTVNHRLWNDATPGYDAATTVQTGTGTRTLTIYNASVPGATTIFWQGPRFATAIAALTPDLTIVSLGHNEAAISSDLWHSRYVGLTESIAAACPGSPLLLIAQNPATANTYQQERREVYREIAAFRGHGFIDVCKAFQDTDDAPGLTVDGLHPNATGSQLWADTVKAAFVHQGGNPRPTAPSTLTIAGEQLLKNGDWSNSVTDWALANCTATVDTANYESYQSDRSTSGSTVTPLARKFTATGAGQATLIQYLPLPRVKGRWVTVAARIYVPAGQATTVGRLALSDSTGSSVSVADSSANGTFRWAVVSRFIPTTATYARVLLYVDSSATGTGNCTIDRMVVTLGKYPHAAATAQAGPAGPAGPTPSALEFMSSLGNQPAAALTATSQTFSIANDAIAVTFRPHRNITVTSLRWIVGAGTSGNYDIGIYDAAGNRLWAKGSTAWPASNTAVTETVDPGVALTAGTDYVLVLAGDNTTGTFRGVAEAVTNQILMLDGTQWSRRIGAAVPLPASLALGATRAGKAPLIMLGGT